MTSTSGASASEKSRILRAQDQEGFAEARERQHRAHADNDPISAADGLKVADFDRRFFSGGLVRRFANAHDEDQNGHQAGNQGDPEDQPEIVMQEGHECDGEQRSGKGAHRIERLPQAVSRAAQAHWHHVAHQRIAGSAADAFADAVRKARGEDERSCGREGEERLRERTEAVADNGERFALAEPVAEPAGEEFRDRGGRFAHAFDQPDHFGTGAEH